MNYAEVEDNVIINVVICDDGEYAAEMGWYALEGLDPMPWIGWSYDGGTWSPPPEAEPPDG